MPRVVPSVVDVDEQGPLRIEGLAPDEFLRVQDDRVALVADYRVELGATTTSIVAAEPGGATIVTDAPLAIGNYALTVHANGRLWYVEDALAVVGETGPDAGDSGDAVDAGDCPAAPAGCTAFMCPSSTSCYYVCAKQRYSDALMSCVTDGLGCLATIDDMTENECIAAATTPMFPDLVWFGYQQASGSMEPAGSWDWVCGSSTFVNWGQSEPNDVGTEDCALIGSSGGWLDANCSSTMRYVCELP
ncbi:MAG: C-type lectin domain-containing protein [Kofleriaceae bacterium]